MKKVVSVSLGSSLRDHKSTVNFDGETIEISRIGCDGDGDKMHQMLLDLDGKVDAMGLGGTTQYIYGKNGKTYSFTSTCKLIKGVYKTPIVDGGGIKNTLESDVVPYMTKELGLCWDKLNVLMVCGLERLGMSEALVSTGAQMLFGDFMFALGLNIPIHKLSSLHRLISVLAPIITRLPLKMLYPTGEDQNKRKAKYGKAFAWADVIAGDYIYIRKYLPDDLTGKIILTNTVTTQDLEELRQRNAKALVTVSPDMQGRSYGTNVLEAVLVAAMQKNPQNLTTQDYRSLLDHLSMRPRIVIF